VKERNFKVGNKDSGERLDHFLVEKLAGDISRSYVQKLIKQKKVLVNAEPASAHHKVKPLEEVSIVIPDPVKMELQAEKILLDIIYEDESILVLNKPAGMVVHPGAGVFSGTLVNALLSCCKNLSGIGGVLRPGIVHRLDKDTSGLMLVAKTDLAHRELSRQFKEREVERKYVGLVRGVVQLDKGKVDLPIGRHPRDRKKMAVSYIHSRYAHTDYKVLRRFKDATMLEITPQTGRTHQIRVHMASLGHPLLGDRKYGIKRNLERQALHACKIKFRHPESKEILEFSIPLPSDLEKFIKNSLQ